MTLEQTYRRLRRLFPTSWRDRNEREFIGTLLDAADPGRDSTSLAEAVDLVRCAIVLRLRAWFAGPVGVGVPGTGVVYTVSSSISGGRRRGVSAAVSCTFGVVPHVLAALLGLSGVMQAGAVAFEVVRWAGVAYLLLLGVSMIRDGGALQLEHSPDATLTPARQIVRRGILLNLLNPKLTVFFFASCPSSSTRHQICSTRD